MLAGMPVRSSSADLSLSDLHVTGVGRLDADLRLLWINPVLAERLGPGLKRWTGAPLAALDSDAGALVDAAHRALAERRTVLLWHARIASGGERDLVCDLAFSPIDDGLLLELHATANASSAAASSSDLSASLRGFAHEVKNPLAGMRGAAQLLQRRVDSAELAELAGLVIAEADRLAALADRLLREGGKPRRLRINVHEALERVAALIAAEADPPTLRRDYDPSLPDAIGDSDRLQQLFLNLARNAVEADARQLILRTRVEHGVRLGERLRRQVLRIDISDNGRGVPADIAETLYQPLVSGRADGSGLGLALAQEIAAEHDGELRHSSRPGATTFTLLLPQETRHAG